MDVEKNMDTPKSEEVWSPEALIGNCSNSSGTGVTSTPYVSTWPQSFKNRHDSEGSSKQDSGYCSLTPRSADSVGIVYGKCHLCSKYMYHGFAQSTPDCVPCTCRKPPTDESSPNLNCMQIIPEVKMSPTPKLPARTRLNRPLELYEEGMDTSLYPEEMEVDHVLGENHQCSLAFEELGDEQSIDFMEPHIFAGTQMLSIETSSTCPPISKPLDPVSLAESEALDIDKRDSQLFKTDPEIFFSPEGDLCNRGLDSPKIKNELTPTKLKWSTPPTKMKKSSNFLSSVKKVATMNRVIRSFSLNGIERVDFLYQLGVKRNIHHVVSTILSFLTEKDLDRVRVVSKTWNKLLYSDFAAFSRWQLYNTAMRMMKENLASPVKASGSGGRNRPALTGLQNMTNQTSPTQTTNPQHQPFSPPVSPNSARFYSFQRAARVLKKDERLLPCPKCYFASTDHGSPIVQCPRSGCRHRFCVWCRNEVFPNSYHNCPPLYTPRSLTRKNSHNVPSVGSKSSKRNLRRL